MRNYHINEEIELYQCYKKELVIPIHQGSKTEGALSLAFPCCYRRSYLAMVQIV